VKFSHKHHCVVPASQELLPFPLYSGVGAKAFLDSDHTECIVVHCYVLTFEVVLTHAFILHMSDAYWNEIIIIAKCLVPVLNKFSGTSLARATLEKMSWLNQNRTWVLCSVIITWVFHTGAAVSHLFEWVELLYGLCFWVFSLLYLSLLKITPALAFQCFDTIALHHLGHLCCLKWPSVLLKGMPLSSEGVFEIDKPCWMWDSMRAM